MVMGLDVPKVVRLYTPTTPITLPLPPEPPPNIAKPARKQGDEQGRASPANKRSTALPIEAPKPIIPPPTVPEIAAAPKAQTGSDNQSGAASVAGIGSGAGGQGDGTGSGGRGTGRGSGGGSRPIWQSGKINDKDYPASSSRAQRGGEVETQFIVEPSGRVTGCRVTKSSGDAALDATTCALIERRFRFRPATNSQGEPVTSEYGWRQSYWLERGR
jgi:protein TonB